MGLIDQIRSGAYRPGADPPLVAPGRVSTMREAAQRVVEGENAHAVARDALDQLARCDDETFRACTADAPSLTGIPRADALLAAIAEHLASRRSIDPPRWANEDTRFLDRFWFVSDVPGFRATAIAQTPISFRRRGILWSERSLTRV